ncbi:MAG: helix-turn-helix transcriptional regulator [Pirellulaceae bacterium]|nr:helix-turn-helix transcriptional regulator [Pirellulaceae bacterium]
MSPAAKPIDESTYSGRFAARLRMLREKTGMSGQQMAEAITDNGFNTPTRTYYGWESRGRDAPLDSYPAIAKAMGVSVRALIPAK